MNIFLYFIGGSLNKVYIDFGISGTLLVNEEDKDKVMLEMSKLIAKFIKNKNVIKLDNNIETADDMDILNQTILVGEA
jgi:hypothetical protein